MSSHATSCILVSKCHFEMQCWTLASVHVYIFICCPTDWKLFELSEIDDLRYSR